MGLQYAHWGPRLDINELIVKAKDKELQNLRKRLDQSAPLRFSHVGDSRIGAKESHGWFEIVVVGFIGLIFTGIGLDAVIRLATGRPIENPAALPSFGVLGLLMVGGAYAMTAYRNVAIIDTMQGSWTREKGIWPRTKVWRGDRSEISGLRTEEITVTYRGRARQVWRTTLEWKDAAVPSLVIIALEREAFMYTHDEAFAHVREFTERLGLSVLD